jgi:hypothetical protein
MLDRIFTILGAVIPTILAIIWVTYIILNSNKIVENLIFNRFFA